MLCHIIHLRNQLHFLKSPSINILGPLLDRCFTMSPGNKTDIIRFTNYNFTILESSNLSLKKIKNQTRTYLNALQCNQTFSQPAVFTLKHNYNCPFLLYETFNPISNYYFGTTVFVISSLLWLCHFWSPFIWVTHSSKQKGIRLFCTPDKIYD